MNPDLWGGASGADLCALVNVHTYRCMLINDYTYVLLSWIIDCKEGHETLSAPPS